MAKLDDVFSEKERTYWLKSWLAIDIAKSGLQHLVKTEAQNFHTSIYTSILYMQTPLVCCNTANLLTCPTPKVCKIWRKTCSMHDPAANYTRPCPVNICDKVRDQIANNHRYRGPSWKCTSAQRWASHPWEIAKCYFPEDGYDLKMSFEETDFNGIISFLLNFKPFNLRFSFRIKQKLTDPPCLLTKAREFCKAVRHTYVCKVTDIDLNDYFTMLADLLGDPTSLAQDSSAQDALMTLQELKQDTFKITTEEMAHSLQEAQKTLQKVEQAAEEAIDEIKKFITICTDDIKSQAYLCKKEMLDRKDECNAEIVAQTVSCKKELHGHTDMCKSEIVAQTDCCKQDIRRSTLNRKLEINARIESCKKTIRVQSDTCKSEIKEKTKTCKEELTAHIIKCKSELDNKASTAKEELYEASRNAFHVVVEAKCNPRNYETAREELKQELKRYYNTRFRHVPVSVLTPLIEKHLLDIYVPPNILKHVKGQTKSVDTYKDILMRDARNHPIILKGEAGTGKTTFSTKIALDWCNDSSDSESTSQRVANFNDKQTLQEYEFVFLVTLRDSPTQMELLHMIKEQIIDNMYGDLDREKMFTLLQIVMQKEPCLLIQDGLDEWNYSNGKSLLPFLPTSYNHCTKLITTRPWKLENSIKDSFVGSLLEISGVNQYMLANNVLVSFARKHTKDVKCEFREYIDKDHLKQFVKVPMMLTIIVCMWVDGMCITGTVCQIYSTLLESLLAKVTNKSEYFNDSPVFCFKNTQFIKPNIEFVKAIAKVAFHSLFSLEREKSLVFSEMELYQYLQHHVDKEEIKLIALNAGILSLRRSSSFINRSPTLSFVHKSMQEFLAAYYIAENMNVIDEEMCGFVIKFEIDVFKYLCGLNINAANKLTCVLYDTVARIDTNQPHFCKSRTFQNILISGYKEAIANGIDESQICLKLSHIYCDRSFSCKADFEILTCILKANILNVRFLFIWGDSLCQHLSEETIDMSLLSVKAAYCINAFPIGGDSLCKLVSEKMKDNTDTPCKLVSEDTKDNTVYAANGMYKVNKGTFELCDLSPCTNLERIHLNGHMVVLSKALYNLKNLKHITIPKYCKVVGCLDLSASLLLETVDLGDIDVVFPTILHGNMKTIKFNCKYEHLNLSSCHNLETIDLSPGVQLTPNAISPHCKIKHLKVLGSCDGLNLPSAHNIETLNISERVRLLPVTLRGNMEQIKLNCMCIGLDLSLCSNYKKLSSGLKLYWHHCPCHSFTI